MSDLSPSGEGVVGRNVGEGNATAGAETLSPLEQEVLDEYARLLGNLNDVCPLPLLGILLPNHPPLPNNLLLIPYPNPHITSTC